MLSRVLKRFSREVFSLYLLISLIAYIGVQLQVNCFSGVDDWFARSGAVMVVLAIIYMILTYDQRTFNGTILAMNTELKIDSMLSDENLKLKVSDEHFTKVMKKSVDKEINKWEFKDLLHEAIVLIIGTLVWGFGDLVITAECSLPT
jgi:hypothetical protein